MTLVMKAESLQKQSTSVLSKQLVVYNHVFKQLGTTLGQLADGAELLEETDATATEEAPLVGTVTLTEALIPTDAPVPTGT